MFSSNNNSSNPFTQFPTSFHLSPSFVGYSGHDIFLHHHHHDLLVGHLLPPNAPVGETVSSMAAINDDSSNSLPKKKHVKKDRHSKIDTAQGRRDRRVRLSIGIARKFFDLQDMLGFDKASKTLDWLFTKSKTAIDELEQMKHRCSGGSKSLSSASECAVSETNEAPDSGDPQGIISPKRKPLTNFKQPHRSALHQLLGRESRAKARARARERTIEKMCGKNRNESKRLPADSSPPTLTQIETCKKLGSHSHSTISSANQAPRNDTIEESIVARRLKPSSAFGYQQDLSKDVNFNNNSPNNPQHWDINSLSRVRAESIGRISNLWQTKLAGGLQQPRPASGGT
ncbi:hypothetical protein F0562_005254 [Nyssa sinensis]|uniref:TCP domain-containing protein n=1 Tax=Nyssa sinensis TaxID=561372 RepID=A0A5J5AHK1_9ASTE|nr:hypothetical protein F0562_005254 [Nyssa sinensis]